MKIYLSFGQDHRHEVDGVVFDKDCIASIECTDYGDGRAKAFKAFGRLWCFAYTKLPRMGYFPRGVIELEATN